MKSGGVVYERSRSSGSVVSSQIGLLTPPSPWRVVITRLMALALLFSFELIVLSIHFDTEDLSRRSGFLPLIGDWGPGVLQALVASAALFVTFGVIRVSSAFRSISEEIARTPVSLQMLAAHGFAMVAFAFLSHLLFGFNFGAWQTYSLTFAWLGAGVLALVSVLHAFIPQAALLALVRQSDQAALIAVAGGVGSAILGPVWLSMWTFTIHATFNLVGLLLSPFLSNMMADPLTRTIGTEKFHVVIHASCSGLEGSGLMLLFGIAWLWFFRKECRFPHALLLLPAGVLLVWLWNSARIATLIWIGNLGFPAVAMGGFHSQAGWIGVNAVALGFSFALCKVPCLMAVEQQHKPAEDNPTARYLAPFLAILAAAMLTQAVADGLEWLYPLRLGAAAAALLYFHRRYSELNWRVGWIGPMAGFLVFVMWLGLDTLNPSQGSVISSRLQSLSEPVRTWWIALRILAAVVTVPIAEELAFRAYLLRRLVAPDFENVSWQCVSLFPILISSLAFGVLHGDRWMEGTLAGVFYALVVRHQGSVGDVVIAHATTNTLLALCVLYTGNWNLL